MPLRIQGIIRRVVAQVHAYLFGFWLNISVVLGILIYLFLTLPPEAYADGRAGAQFYDNAFGSLLNFFTQGTAFWRLAMDVAVPLLILFFLCACVCGCEKKGEKDAYVRGFFGVILSAVALFMLMMTYTVAALARYRVQDYREPIIEQYWNEKRAAEMEKG